MSAQPALVADSSVAAVGAAPASVPAEEVRVRGDAIRDALGVRDRSVAGSVVTRERLTAPGLEAPDVLRTQPGVAIVELGGFGAPATAAIRGATAVDTPVYLANVRLNDDVGGTADLSLVPLWLIDHIEIYRGNAPLEADRLGPGGAIFFEPRRPSRPSAGAGYYGGSWGSSKGWAYVSLGTRAASAIFGISVDHATNRYPFLDDHGQLFKPATTVEHRRNDDETTVEAWAVARLELGGGAVAEVVANGISREQGVPSLALMPTRRARERADRELAAFTVRAPVGKATRIDARTALVLGGTAYRDPLLELALYTRALRIAGRRIEQTVGATTDVLERLRVRSVLTVAREGIARDPDDIPLAGAHREFGRLAVSVDAEPVEGARVHVLASAECHHTGGERTCDVLAPTGRVGADVGWGPVHLLANAGRYVRVPTLGELYGVSGTVHGNRDLAPESGWTADAGVRAQSRRLGALDGAYVDAFVFARWADGLVAYRRTGQGYVTPYNVGGARVLGAELLGGLGLAGALRLELAVTALDPRDTSAHRTTVNDVLPFRSRLIAAPRLRADWHPAAGGACSGVGVEIQAVYQSSRYVDPAGLGIVAAQTSVDIELDASWLHERLMTRVRVADALDAPRTDIIGYPLPARSAYFGLETSW